jgi:hypothetical protein
MAIAGANDGNREELIIFGFGWTRAGLIERGLMCLAR